MSKEIKALLEKDVAAAPRPAAMKPFHRTLAPTRFRQS
jgi:hypothetical protein